MAVPASRNTLLLVDDDPEIRDSLTTLLEVGLPGYKVKALADARSALDYLKDNKVDLIITDYMMPGMNGVDFLNALQKMRVRAPAIMITAYPEPELANKAVNEAGAAMVISKPFEMDLFVRIVATLVAA